ncbi:hypothetical protein [Cryobacterium cheniae]|nr:hypothetical protein [Cryobacterium cheniae]
MTARKYRIGGAPSLGNAARDLVQQSALLVDVDERDGSTLISH